MTAFFMNIQQSLAVSAYPHPVEYNLPDGTTITIQLMGDEKVKWAETLDGFSILLNAEGFYEYAILDANDDMVRSGIRASNTNERTNTESAFLMGIAKNLRFSKSQISLMNQIWEVQEKEASKAFPTTGNRKLICILIGYADLAFTKTQSDFNNLFNQVGYSAGGATGSVKDYYLENSYNQFNLTVDVAGPYTASQNMAYYGANDGYGYDIRPRELVLEAINLADPDVDFSEYDNDDDGWVDGVYIIYAGYGEEAGGGANAIWAHAWWLASPVLKDGVYLQRYSCSAELRSNTGSTITAIGVICHEFGHVLGAPDYYDTDYAIGGEFQGTGQWDMMASGSWNNGGVTPAHHNGFTKVYYYNWASATLLTSATTITLNNAAEHSNSFYRYNTTTTNEFFLLENREKHLFDGHIPGSGMIIYHVHSTVFAAGVSNNINNTHPQKMYPVSQNATMDPTATPSSYGNINAATCAWTGVGKTQFTDATLPSSKSWAGANTNKPITNISRNVGAKTVTFDFMGGSVSDQTVTFNVKDQFEVPIEGAMITVYPEGAKNQAVLSASNTNKVDIRRQSIIDQNRTSDLKLESKVANEPIPLVISESKEGQWIHWDDGIYSSGIGLNSAGYFTVASRWTPADIASFEGLSITELYLYISDLPLGAVAKIWQGANETSLVEYHSQAFSPIASSWNLIELNTPYQIDVTKELWFGYEINDPGAGVYPAGRDATTNYDGKGNKIKLGTGEWANLSGYGLEGDWNIQAYLENLVIEPIILYTNASGQATFDASPGSYTYTVEKEGYSSEDGDFDVVDQDVTVNVTLVSESTETYSLTLTANPSDIGAVLTGAGNYAEGANVNISASTVSGYTFTGWTGSAEDVALLGDASASATSFLMPSRNVTLTATYELYQIVYLLPFTEDFTDLGVGTIPVDWARTHANWGVVATANAGGVAPEMRFNWTPSATDEFRLHTPFIDGDLDENLYLVFKHMVNDYSGDYNLSVQATIDGSTWDILWEIDVEDNIAANLMEIDLSDYQGEVFMLAFVFNGNSYNINYWYIDDVYIGEYVPPVFYTLTLVADPAAGGTVIGDGEYEEGDEVTVTATANTGYEFVNWTDASQAVVSTNASFVYTMPAADVTLTANFEEQSGDTYTVTFNVKNQNEVPIEGAMITVMPGSKKKVETPLILTNRREGIKGNGEGSDYRLSAVLADLPTPFIPEISKEGDWISWDDGENANGIGTGAAAEFSIASRWLPADLQDYDGMYITQISFFPRVEAAQYTVRIWTGVNHTQQYAQDVEEFNVMEWNTVELETPYQIDASDEMMFGVFINTTTGHPAGCDAGPALVWKGDVMYYNNEWISMMESFSLNYNWNIQAYVEVLNIEPIVLYTNASGQASFDANVGDYTYTVEKTGHSSAGGDFSVLDQHQTINVTLYEDAPLNTVTFNVDLTGVEGFDPAEHTVYLVGTITDPVWIQPGYAGSIVMDLVYGSKDTPYTWEESWEEYDDFTTDLTPWVTHLINDDVTWGASDFDFPGEGEPFAFMVFNPSETDPDISGNHPAYDGSKYLIAVQSQTINDNKWLISPATSINETSEFSFAAKSITASYGLERFRVLVSTTGTATDDFTQISAGNYIEAPTSWQLYTFDLSDYAGEVVHIAIQYVSYDAFIFMLDDFKVTTQVEPPDELIYTATLQLEAGTYEYKYFSDAFGPGWEGGEWDGMPNRVVVVDDDMVQNDIWGLLGTFMVTLLANPDDIGAVLTGGGFHEVSTVVNITASTVSGYTFTSWTGSAEDVALLANASAQSTSFTMPARAVTLTANYEEQSVDTYTVTFIVRNPENSPIAGASISIAGHGNLTTNASGVATTQLPNGNYSFTVIASGYAVYSDVFTIADANRNVLVILTPVGVEEDALTTLEVFPNPFENSITLNNASRVSRLIITNIIGQRVMDIQLPGSERITIPTEELTKGVYLMIFEAGNGERVVRRMVKE